MEIEQDIEHLVRVSINAGLCLQELHASKAGVSGSGWPFVPHSWPPTLPQVMTKHQKPLAARPGRRRTIERRPVQTPSMTPH